MVLRILAFLRVVRPQWILLFVMAFVVGYLGTGRITPLMMTLGIMTHAFCKIAQDLFNAYADRREDLVNQPEYVVDVETIGYRNCYRIAVGLLIVCALLSGPYVVKYPLAMALAWLLGVPVAVQYSIGLRFKAHTVLSLMALFLSPVAPFLVGWTLGRGTSIPMLVGCTALVLGYFRAVNRTTRYFHDVIGDLQAGVATFFTYLAVRPRAWVWQLMLASPYLLVVLLVTCGWLPQRFLWLLLLWPAALVHVAMLVKARTNLQARAAWEWGTLYATITHLAILIAFNPALPVWWLAGGAFGVRLLLAQLRLDSHVRLETSLLITVTWTTLVGTGNISGD